MGLEMDEGRGWGRGVGMIPAPPVPNPNPAPIPKPPSPSPLRRRAYVARARADPAVECVVSGSLPRGYATDVATTSTQNSGAIMAALKTPTADIQ